MLDGLGETKQTQGIPSWEYMIYQGLRYFIHSHLPGYLIQNVKNLCKKASGIKLSFREQNISEGVVAYSPLFSSENKPNYEDGKVIMERKLIYFVSLCIPKPYIMLITG